MSAPTALDTSAAPTDPVIDESSISPSRAGMDTLEKRLAQRPEAQDLKNRNILMDTSAAP
jgi:RPEL repeat protein